jgi:GNAT superfamily N-acetyltransferase
VPVTLIEAGSAADYASARALFVEYARQLNIDLCFQHFDAELEHLPEMYGPPAGCILLAREEGGGETSDVGCVAVRRLSAEICEMKRLYVQDRARGQGLGRLLAQASLDAARARGYRRMVLDTLASMTPARTLYASLGFRETAAYYANPLPDVVYMAVDLGS